MTFMVHTIVMAAALCGRDPGPQVLSPLEYVQMQQVPHLNASANSILAPIMTFWPTLDNITLATEMAEKWGYALKVGPYLSSKVVDDCQNPLDDPTGTRPDQLAFQAARKNPGKYTVELVISKEYNPGQDYMGAVRPEAYARDSRGNFILDSSGSKIASPAMPESVYRRMGQARELGIQVLADAIGGPDVLNGALVLNSGEYGVGTAGFGKPEDLLRDPNITAAFASGTWGQNWDEFGWRSHARIEGLLSAAVRRAVPQRAMYLRYTADCARDRLARGDAYGGQYTDTGAYGYGAHPAPWLPQYTWPLHNFSDLPSGESYFHAGWGSGTFEYNGPGWDMLSQELNSFAQHIALGHPRPTMWLSASMPSPFDHGRKAAKYPYMGYLKVLYLAGMKGAIEQSYGSMDGWNPQRPDASFNATDPPAWLDHMLWHGHVRGAFTWLQDFIESSDLLPGPMYNRMSWDLPAYEIPPLDNHDPNVRIVCRQHRTAPEWLCVAWLACDFNTTLLTTTATIDLPTLGNVSLTNIRSCGSIYRIQAPAQWTANVHVQRTSPLATHRDGKSSDATNPNPNPNPDPPNPNPNPPIVTLLDPDADHPSAAFGPNGAVPTVAVQQIPQTPLQRDPHHHQQPPANRNFDGETSRKRSVSDTHAFHHRASASESSSSSSNSSPPPSPPTVPVVGLVSTGVSVKSLFVRPGDPITPRYAFAVRIATDTKTPRLHPIEVMYNITDGGTAIPGVDYTGVPPYGTVTIQPGWPGWTAVRALPMDNPAATKARSICVQILPSPTGAYTLDRNSVHPGCNNYVYTHHRPSVWLTPSDLVRDGTYQLWNVEMRPPPLNDTQIRLNFTGEAKPGVDVLLPYNTDLTVTIPANRMSAQFIVSAPQPTTTTATATAATRTAAGVQSRLSTAGTLRSSSSSTLNGMVTVYDDGRFDLDASPVPAGTFTVSNPTGKPVTAMPYATPFPGTYDTPQTVALHCDTPNADLYVTTDGSVPNVGNASQRYTGPLTLVNHTHVQAIASAPGHNDSALAVAGYYFAAAQPTAIPPNGTALSPTDTVTLATASAGAAIWYRTDGGVPLLDSTCDNGVANQSTLYTKPFTIPANASTRDGGWVRVVALAVPKDGDPVKQSDVTVLWYQVGHAATTANAHRPSRHGGLQPAKDIVANDMRKANDVAASASAEKHVFWGSAMGGGPSYDNCTVCAKNKNLYPTFLAKIQHSPTTREPNPKPINMTESVQDALTAMQALPPGQRVVYVAQSFAQGNMHPADNIGSNASLSACDPKHRFFVGLWWDNGAAAVREGWADFLKAFFEAGGGFDGIMLDMETGFEVWSFLIDPESDQPTQQCLQQKLDLIQADKRFPPLLAQLKDLGFTADTSKPHYLFDAFMEMAGNISTIGYNANAAAWNGVMTPHTKTYFREAIFTPAKAKNASAWLAEYDNYQMGTSVCTMDFNGFRLCDFVNSTTTSVTGTHQAPQIYGEMNNISRSWAMPGTSTTLHRLYNMSEFDFSPFNGVLLDVNFFRAQQLVDNALPNRPWFSYPSFTSGTPGTQCPWCTNVTWLGYQDYWSEAIFHTGLSGADDFFFFAPCYHVNGAAPGTCPNMATVADNAAFSATLAELTQMAGYTNRSWVRDHLADWQDGYVLSGMQLPTNQIWRLTGDFGPHNPDPHTLLTQTSPTVIAKIPDRDGGATEIDFGTGSRVVTTTEQSVSRVGLWIESKTTPVRRKCAVDDIHARR